MEQENLIKLLGAYMEGAVSGTEASELTDFIKQEENAEAVTAALQTIMAQTPKGDSYDSARFDPLLKNILQADKTTGSPKEAKIISWSLRRIAAAAAILIGGAGAYLLFVNKPTQQPQLVKTIPANDIKAPITNRATITLANGQRVYLDSAANGELVKQGNVQVTKSADGKIEYEATNEKEEALVSYNTLTNPRGSKVIDITLADGSRVWLNAGSTIKYPVLFTGKERKVTMDGEAYFEITHNAAMPFKVNKGSLDITVLGTHFNVNTYEDEADSKVTLLEGSVKIVANNQSIILKPGEQAVAATNATLTLNRSPDTEQVMAWKNGMFRLNNTNIEVIMRQVARWYDVEVKYQGQFKELNFGGNVSRKSTVAELLKRLEATGAVHFIINGHTITVTK